MIRTLGNISIFVHTSGQHIPNVMVHSGLLQYLMEYIHVLLDYKSTRYYN